MKAFRSWSEAIVAASQERARVDAEAGPPSPPADLPEGELDLWIVQQEIEATRKEMHRIRLGARTGLSTHGLGALGKRLDELIDRRRALKPPPKRTEDDEEREWRATAEATVTMILGDVVKRETDATNAGVCIHCQRPLKTEPTTEATTT
jgi:hypothetical protein